MSATDLSAGDLEAYLQRMFRTADRDGNGVLDKDEFVKVGSCWNVERAVQLMKASGYRFSPQQISQVMHKADANQDDVIQYDEFARVVVSIVKGEGSLQEAAPAKQAALPSLSEIPEAHLKEYLKQLFELADEDGNGVLDKAEFAKIMRVMAEADANQDEVIQYDEVAAAATTLTDLQFAQVLVDVLKGTTRPDPSPTSQRTGTEDSAAAAAAADQEIAPVDKYLSIIAAVNNVSVGLLHILCALILYTGSARYH